MTTKHTLTPWRLFKTPRPGRAAAAYYIQGPNGRAVAHVKNSTVSPIAANAAHIVRCVNSHDALVKALQAAAKRFREYETLHAAKPDPVKADSNAVMAAMCEAALTQAQP